MNDDALERLARIEQKLDDHLTGIDRTVSDHETRMRSLERWRYAVPPALIISAVSMLITLRP